MYVRRHRNEFVSLWGAKEAPSYLNRIIININISKINFWSIYNLLKKLIKPWLFHERSSNSPLIIDRYPTQI